MSLNVDFDKLDRKKFNSKEFVFVTEDGKTAECFEEIGKNFWIDSVYAEKNPGLKLKVSLHCIYHNWSDGFQPCVCHRI